MNTAIEAWEGEGGATLGPAGASASPGSRSADPVDRPKHIVARFRAAFEWVAASFRSMSDRQVEGKRSDTEAPAPGDRG